LHGLPHNTQQLKVEATAIFSTSIDIKWNQVVHSSNYFDVSLNPEDECGPSTWYSHTVWKKFSAIIVIKFVAYFKM